MFFLKKLYTKSPVLIVDMLAVPIAWYLAYWLRYNLSPFPFTYVFFESSSALALVFAVHMVCYYHFKVYRGIWRFSSLSDLLRILRTVFFSILLALPLLYECSLLNKIPRSVLPLYALILTTGLCSGRLLRRYLWDLRVQGPRGDTTRVLVIGASEAAESLIRDLKRTDHYWPIGLIDDQAEKKGLEIHGVRVLGAVSELSMIAEQYGADLILIAMPRAGSVAMRRIVSFCEQSAVPFRTLPSLHAITAGHVSVDAFREVNLEDLLGRDQVELDWARIRAGIEGRRVVLTGAGGSIGSELCRQIAALNPAHVLLIENGEFNLYKIEHELRALFPDLSFDVALVDVTDEIAIEALFARTQPELVFHAAAYKHVPLLENQCRAAVLNNMIGTQVVAQASINAGVKQFVFISTDKAVNPTNVLGMTKRIAELYCQQLNARVSTQFITVRFGNVLGSVGSVVPLFKAQLQRGGPLTVTHPEITRYFMTIAESCQLILQAMVHGEGGEIFVLNMGESVKISYLAEQMIRMAGKVPHQDIEIQYTGLRPGEKLYEELFYETETRMKTSHEKLFKAVSNDFTNEDWPAFIHECKNACALYQVDILEGLLKRNFNTQLSIEHD